jgi:cobalamin biosynthesis protein CobD/CbiB
MGAGRREADAADIRRALRLYGLASVIQAMALAGVAATLLAFPVRY